MDQGTSLLYEELAHKKLQLESLVAKIVAAKRDRVAGVPADAKPDLNEIGDAAQDGPSPSAHFKQGISALTTEAAVLLVDLRRINRGILTLEESAKAETESVKQPVESTTLVLNNLQYEASYYSKAINACRDFRTKYLGIELVDVSSFLREAPEHLRVGFEEKARGKGAMEVGEGSEPSSLDMEMMIPRLGFELLQRKQLAKQRQELETRKKALQEGIATRKKFLSGLPAQLKVLKSAAQPLQQHLHVAHSTRQKQHRKAVLLPAPLYILYSQVLAYQALLSDGPEPAGVSVTVEGSVRDAEALGKREAQAEGVGVREARESKESREDEATQEEDDSAARRRRKGGKDSSSNSNRVPPGASIDDPSAAAPSPSQGSQSAHPLSVLLTVHAAPSRTDSAAHASPSPFLGPAGEGRVLLVLRFQYLMKLEVVTVEAEKEGDANFACDLFPGDSGLVWPNAATQTLAQDLIPALAYARARPYLWCQQLAGLDILPDVPPSLLPDPSKATKQGEGSVKGRTLLRLRQGLGEYGRQRRVGAVVAQLRQRKDARDALAAQLKDLAALRLPVSPASSPGPWTRDSGVPSTGRLVAWAPLSLVDSAAPLIPGDSNPRQGALAAREATGDDDMLLSPDRAAVQELLTSVGLTPVQTRELVHRWLTSEGALPPSVQAWGPEGLVGVQVWKAVMTWQGKGGKSGEAFSLGLLVCVFPDHPYNPPLWALYPGSSTLANTAGIRLPSAPAECLQGAKQESAVHPLCQPLAFWGAEREVNLSKVPESNDGDGVVGPHILGQQLQHTMVLVGELLQPYLGPS